MLTQKEQARLQVLNGVLQHQIPVDEAAQVLGVSERHLWRILAAYRKEGAAALAHKNRGRRPANAIPEDLRDQIITLARTRYSGVNHTHLAELLVEREDVALGCSTVRRILVGAGIASPRRRRPPRHRVRRERMGQEGMLVQIDGSPHHWLEERGPLFTLLLAVDDATSTVAHARFHEQEDTPGYFLLLQGLIQRHGIPLALYSDRHGVFQASWDFQVLPGDTGLTQFGRAMRELGIQQIFARSPQAKGRVERIAGIFQDRLVSELRLAGASTLTEANEILSVFLSRFNQRFGVPPAQEPSAYRPAPTNLQLTGILCFKHRRKVAKDNTVKYKWRTLQLLPTIHRPSYAGAHVEVQERMNGCLIVYYQGQIISTQEAPPRPGTLRVLNGVGVGLLGVPEHQRQGVLPDKNGNSGQYEGMVIHAPSEETRSANTAGIQDTRSGSLVPLPSRQPTPRQRARWEAVQEARQRGLSLKAIARELGISRNTARKYAAAINPPLNLERRPSQIGGDSDH